jgi:hypothetical protein
LDLQFVEDFPIVPFNGVQGDEESLANLAIGKPLGDELKYFELALAKGSRTY